VGSDTLAIAGAVAARVTCVAGAAGGDGAGAAGADEQATSTSRLRRTSDPTHDLARRFREAALVAAAARSWRFRAVHAHRPSVLCNAIFRCHCSASVRSAHTGICVVIKGLSWQRGDQFTGLALGRRGRSLRSRSIIEDIMWALADRVVRAVSDVTVGTVIVLVHVAMADRADRAERPRARRSLATPRPSRLPS
jgi:hypothetical protein